MLCTRCGGVLYLDSRSVSDLSFSGYSGGRYFCLMGCAGTWIKEREVEPKQPMPTERAELRKGEHHTIRHIICADCHQTTVGADDVPDCIDRKSTRLNSSH